VRLRLALGPNARLTVRSTAATVARRGPEPTEWSRFGVTVDLGAGAALAWLVEPSVASAGCRHYVEVEIRIGPGCALIWRDELILGRHGERPGSWSTSLRADLDGRALLRQRLDVGPHAPGWDGPAIAGAARAVGSLLMVQPGMGIAPSPAPPLRSDLGRLSVMPLAGPAVLVSALASTAGGLRQILERHAGGHRT
jgi:urease accessory protein